MSRSAGSSRTAIRVVAGIVVIATAGCIRSATDLVRADRPTPATVVDADSQLEIGEAVRSPEGATVGLLEVETDRSAERPEFSTLVEACAGPRARSIVFEPSAFQLVTEDRLIHSPTDPTEARGPALHRVPVAVDECHIGWLTFRPDEGEAPAFLVWSSDGAGAAWRIGSPPVGQRTPGSDGNG